MFGLGISRQTLQTFVNFAWVLSLGVLFYLLFQSVQAEIVITPTLLWSLLLFGVLIVFSLTLGISSVGGLLSVYPMAATAAFLVLGPVLAGWIIYVGAWLHGVIRYCCAPTLGMPPEPDRKDLARRTAINSFMTTASMLSGGILYEMAGGELPVTGTVFHSWWPLALYGVGYFTVNHLTIAAYFGVHQPELLKPYWRRVPVLLLYEWPPLLVAPFGALVYSGLGLFYFALLTAVIFLVSYITFNLDKTRRRLERRVQELNSLQAVGQVLSSTLQLETILMSIYVEVEKLMPATTFFVALYDREEDRVTFPLAIQEGRFVRWSARVGGNGLTEYIIRTKRPLLVKKELSQVIHDLGLQQIGDLAVSWLGVPMMAGGEPVGVISVQSLTQENVYDVRHQEILMTIAAQAAVALENARRYARTDTALKERIQQLDSIMYATHDGLLLLDLGWRILAINKAFSRLFSLPETALEGALATDWEHNGHTLIHLMGYTPETLTADCQKLLSGRATRIQSRIFLPHIETHMERTLAPVFDRNQQISGWLLVFHDITEQMELNQLREDMTHMLIHDLRAPLSVAMGSLETVRLWLKSGKEDECDELIDLAQSSHERMLRLLNDMLDVYRLESGKLSLYRHEVPPLLLLEEVRNQLLPLAQEANIRIDIEYDEDTHFPDLFIDYAYLSRVMINLLDNAIKFTPDNGRIRMWIKPDEQPDSPTLLLGISDNGMGIPPEKQALIFKKFQHDITKGGRRAGTGLGLPFCKLVVEAHGGEIWVESDGINGHGTTFILRLPIALSSAGQSEKQESRPVN
ncbi:MAG: GAF domain-containing protein [Chloroflexi bacterium]|nr:MAG: GAF domain-containing protein [Chloroflexota bacterium]